MDGRRPLAEGASADDAGEEVDELLPPRLVDAEVALHLGEALGGAGLAARELGRVGGHEVEDREARGRDEEEDDECAEDPGDDESEPHG
ncbi:Uncharacterised protein [Mycobacteroides abscessus subsp. abscessus]|nr:Uncharacterised protein [Mycobacteroides abscessus subsp. abscessus]